MADIQPVHLAQCPKCGRWLIQTTGWTCLPASATMLLHHHGIATTEGEMAYLANTSYLGTDVHSIAQALMIKGQPHGLTPRIEYADYESCLQRPGPFVACIRIPHLGSHAVFVLRAAPEGAELIDPRIGQRQKIDRGEIESQWESKIVFLEIGL